MAATAGIMSDIMGFLKHVAKKKLRTEKGSDDPTDMVVEMITDIVDGLIKEDQEHEEKNTPKCYRIDKDYKYLREGEVTEVGDQYLDLRDNSLETWLNILEHEIGTIWENKDTPVRRKIK